MTSQLNNNHLPKLYITMHEQVISRFATILQSGFYYQTTKGRTVSSLLSELPGFTDEYNSKHLQTVFLNGDAIDDFGLRFSEDSNVLALSAAMPGLAGAIFRKSSPIGALRKTAPSQKITENKKPVSVLVKLFNNIAIDRGPNILAQGVIFRSSDLITFLDLRPSIINSMTQIIFDNIQVETPDFSSLLAKHNLIILTCKSTHA